MPPKPHPSHIPRFYSVHEIAKQLDVSERTIRHWITSNELAAHKLGRAVRVSDSDLRDFLARRRGF